MKFRNFLKGNIMEKIFKITVIILVIIGYSLLIAYPILLLWNWLFPAIFGLTKITFMQAFGLNLLFSILFKRVNTNFKF